MSKIAVGFFVFAVAAFNAATPQRPVDVWTLSFTAGDVSVDAALSAGDPVPADTTIRTGRYGRALLTRGSSAMLVGPGTTLRVDTRGHWVPVANDRPAVQADHVVVSPARTAPVRPSFGIDRSLLAAVVKA